ncbi:hypothetical protein V0288_13005 [Pannus brasiliensis CCIBt3594]|uniref:Uncharacterized protein n=1 Tax=Pannus brasiliensis CCIBt3594 TaxID=1427578 RepID=A0AAW9QY72_9CHRO
MKTRGDKLIEQIQQARKIGQGILRASELDGDGVIYAFATADALVINCADHETLWRLEEGENRLRQTIARLKYSIETIFIEKCGKTCYQF